MAARAVVFSSPVFLFVFLPAVLLAAALAGGFDRLLAARRGARFDAPIAHPLQNIVLLAFSIVFYVYGSGRDVVILLSSILVSWAGGLLIAHTPWKRTVLAAGIAGQLAALGWFKYANFVVGEVNAVRVAAGDTAIVWSDVVLPIGISFFIFQGISYLIDVYRNDCVARTNLLELALFKALFPQLIAGPIVRYVHVEHELDARQVTLHEVANGATRFVFGLFKKLAIADSVAMIADAAFALPTDELTASAALLGSIAWTFQIYFDFSAYSDMAIGLGHMFGFRIPENFTRPLSATSITDFWRRWHITLSTWFRDYLYVPLGGSRGSALKTYRNLWIVFLLSGLWHGASWTFVLWGAAHGLLLTIERLAGITPQTGPRWRRATTFVLVVLTFTIFRADTIEQAMAFYGHLLLPFDVSLPLTVYEALTTKNVLFLLVATASLLLPLQFTTGVYLETATSTRAAVVRFVVVTVVAVYTMGLVASANFSPFIYFRF